MSGLLIDLGVRMLIVVRSFGVWVFVVALLCTDYPVFGQGIDVKSLPEDVLNCDECRRRLGLPPLTDPNRKPSSHGADPTIVPSTNATHNENILSTRVLPGPNSTTPSTTPATESSSKVVPHNSNKPVLPNTLPKIEHANGPKPSLSAGNNNPAIEKKREPAPSPGPSISKPTLPAPPSSPTVADAKPEIQTNPSLTKVQASETTTTKTESASASASAMTTAMATVLVEPKQPIDSKPNRDLKKEPELPSVQPAGKQKFSQEGVKDKPQTAPEQSLTAKSHASIAKTPASESGAKNTNANKGYERSKVENRIPPALTGEVNASEASDVATANVPSAAIKPNHKEDDGIAIAVPTSSAAEASKTVPQTLPTSDANKPSNASENHPTTSQIVSMDPTSVIPSSLDNLIVDGVLTSPTAQKIQIDLLRRQLNERDNLLNEFSRTQKSLEERIDSIVRSNEQLSQKENLRANELDRVQRESEKNVQERDLQIANLRAELAGARAETKSQLTMLSKQLTETQQSKSAEIAKLSDELLAAKKARINDINLAKVQQSGKHRNDLVQAEKVIEEQRKMIQDLQTALKKLGSQLEKLDNADKVEKIAIPIFPADESRSTSEIKVANNKDSKVNESKPQNSSESSSKSASDSEGESKTESLAKPADPLKSESNPKRRSF
jgi:ribosomal protein L18E